MNEYFRSFIVSQIGFIDKKQGILPVRVLEKGAGYGLRRKLVLTMRQRIVCLHV